MGHYLADDHTFEHFRENWIPGLFDRSTFADWRAEGSLDLGARANARAVEILAQHQAPALDEHALGTIDKLLEKAEKEAAT
jgi:trimethylamine--corrinoid protein Co-methyltransferase